MIEHATSKQVRHDRMKNYGRWLMYGGVENLPADKILAHMVKSPPKKGKGLGTPDLAGNMIKKDGTIVE